MKGTNEMKKKIFKKVSAIIVIALVVVVFAALSVNVSAEEAYVITYETPSKVWTDSNNPSGKMTYDSDTKTLTLENWTINGTLKITTYDNATQVFTIILKGDNVSSDF